MSKAPVIAPRPARDLDVIDGIAKYGSTFNKPPTIIIRRSVLVPIMIEEARAPAEVAKINIG